MFFLSKLYVFLIFWFDIRLVEVYIVNDIGEILEERIKENIDLSLSSCVVCS